MKHIKILTVLLSTAMLFTACGKDNTKLIIGNWTNTDQSYEITIAGQQSILADAITMEFTANSVRISDMRCNCVPTWEHYTLTTENGKQILHVNNGIHGDYVVEELTADKLLLTSSNPSIDMDFMYTMERLK